MHIINTRVHGMLDYIVGALLVIAPWLLGFATGGIEQWLPMLLGALTILMSLFTDYELGLLRVILFRVHRTLDLASGALLAVSPSRRGSLVSRT